MRFAVRVPPKALLDFKNLDSKAMLENYDRVFDEFVIVPWQGGRHMPDPSLYPSSKVIRGHTLFHETNRRSKTWQETVNWAADLSAAIPNSYAWNVFHECYGAHRNPTKWWRRGQFWEWVREAFKTAQRIAPQSEYYISEYAPRDYKRWQWVIDFCRRCREENLPLAGVSVQLHSNLISRQTYSFAATRELLVQAKKELNLAIDIHETAVFDGLAEDFPHRPPMGELIQAHRYAAYRRFAEAVESNNLGLWHAWDAEPWEFRGKTRLTGIWRADWSKKPSFNSFLARP